MSDKKKHLDYDDPIKQAEQCGIDISLIKENLSLNYAERIRRHQIALDTMQKLQKAKDA